MVLGGFWDALGHLGNFGRLWDTLRNFGAIWYGLICFKTFLDKF